MVSYKWAKRGQPIHLVYSELVVRVKRDFEINIEIRRNKLSLQY